MAKLDFFCQIEHCVRTLLGEKQHYIDIMFMQNMKMNLQGGGLWWPCWLPKECLIKLLQNTVLTKKIPTIHFLVCEITNL